MKNLFSTLLFAFFSAFALTFTACGDEEEDDVPPPAAEDFTPHLQLSKTEILANGADTAFITVVSNSVDVTDEALVFLNGEPFNDRAFATKKVGSYVFHAVYKNQVTDKLTLTAAPDPDADYRYTDFRRRLLAVQYTGTWCGYCPRVSLAIKRFKETDAHPDDIVFAAAHSRDVMETEFGAELISFQAITGFPTLMLNLNANSKVTDSPYIETGAAHIAQARTNAIRTPACSNIRAEVSEPDENGIINIDAEVKVNTTGKYRVAAWLLEDNVYAPQSDYYNYGEEAIHTHNNVVCASTAPTSAIGNYVTTAPELEAENAYPVSLQLCPKTQCVKDPANCRVIIVVTRAVSSLTFTVDNVIECPIGGKKDYEYTD